MRDNADKTECSGCTDCPAPGVLILGGHVQGLGLARSFGRSGIKTVVIDKDTRCIARFSKYCQSFLHSPALWANLEEDAAGLLLELARSTGAIGWLVMPTEDRMVAVLSKYKDALATELRVPVPPWAITQHAYDKALTFRLATDLSIPTPMTVTLRGLDGLEVATHGMRFPVIVKPRVMHDFVARTHKKAVFARDVDELKRAVRWACKYTNPSELLVQEFIPGGGEGLYSWCGFYKHGQIVAGCCAQRLRQIPMDFGRATTYARTLDIPELAILAHRLLKGMGYYGLCEVEFMFDPRDHKFKLLEVNPRTWKWHTLVLRAGLNLPLLLYKDTFATAVGPVGEVRQGIAWRDFYTDTYVAAVELLRGRLRLTDFFHGLRVETECSVADSRDPFPFIAETVLLGHIWRSR